LRNARDINLFKKKTKKTRVITNPVTFHLILSRHRFSEMDGKLPDVKKRESIREVRVDRAYLRKGSLHEVDHGQGGR